MPAIDGALRPPAECAVVWAAFWFLDGARWWGVRSGSSPRLSASGSGTASLRVAVTVVVKGQRQVTILRTVPREEERPAKGPSVSIPLNLMTRQTVAIELRIEGHKVGLNPSMLLVWASRVPIRWSRLVLGRLGGTAPPLRTAGPWSTRRTWPAELEEEASIPMCVVRLRDTAGVPDDPRALDRTRAVVRRRGPPRGPQSLPSPPVCVAASVR